MKQIFDSIPSAIVEASKIKAVQIVENNEANRNTPWFGGKAEDHHKGLIAMKMCCVVLNKIPLDYKFDQPVGVFKYTDITILNKPYEIKSGTCDDIHTAIISDGFDFLVPFDQFNAGRSRGIVGYISMLLKRDFSESCFMGWIPTELVPVDKEGNKREIKTHTKTGQKMRAPAYIVPFSDLNGTEDFAP